MYWSGMEQNNGIVDNSFSERHKKHKSGVKH